MNGDSMSSESAKKKKKKKVKEEAEQAVKTVDNFILRYSCPTLQRVLICILKYIFLFGLLKCIQTAEYMLALVPINDKLRYSVALFCYELLLSGCVGHFFLKWEGGGGTAKNPVAQTESFRQQLRNFWQDDLFSRFCSSVRIYILGSDGGYRYGIFLPAICDAVKGCFKRQLFKILVFLNHNSCKKNLICRVQNQ